MIELLIIMFIVATNITVYIFKTKIRYLSLCYIQGRLHIYIFQGKRVIIIIAVSSFL